MFAPTKEAVSAVREWLSAAGINGDRVRQSQSLNWIYTNVTIAEAESLLRAHFYEFTHVETGQTHVACEEYSVPEGIQKHIDFITPTVHFDAKVDLKKKRRAMTAHDIAMVKRQASKVGHKVQPGVGRAIGSPGDKSLPKLGGKIPFGTIIDELKNCDSSIVPNCLRALYLLPPKFLASSKSKSLSSQKKN